MKPWFKKTTTPGTPPPGELFRPPPPITFGGGETKEIKREGFTFKRPVSPISLGPPASSGSRREPIEPPRQTPIEFSESPPSPMERRPDEAQLEAIDHLGRIFANYISAKELGTFREDRVPEIINVIKSKRSTDPGNVLAALYYLNLILSGCGLDYLLMTITSARAREHLLTLFGGDTDSVNLIFELLSAPYRGPLGDSPAEYFQGY